jgi:hypothetical protein
VEFTELGLARLLLVGVVVGGKTELGAVLIVEGSVEEGLGTLAAERQPQAAENDELAGMKMDRGLDFCGFDGGVVELDVEVRLLRPPHERLEGRSLSSSSLMMRCLRPALCWASS